MFFISLLALLILIGAFLVVLSGGQHEYSALRNIEKTTKVIEKKETDFQKLEKKLDIGAHFIGKHNGLKIALFAAGLLIISCGILGPLLTNAQFGIFLGLIITAAYTSRAIFEVMIRFRKNLLSQLERIFSSIRNNLSTGMTLDYAVNESLKYNREEPLGPSLGSFIRSAEGNFLEKFPQWLQSVQRIYRLKQLAESSQLLALELNHTNNQEEAFVHAATSINNRQKINDKQKNTLFISFITLDFMVFGYLALLFMIIPQISPDWWASSERPLIIFLTGFALWSAYLITILISFRRQA